MMNDKERLLRIAKLKKKIVCMFHETFLERLEVYLEIRYHKAILNFKSKPYERPTI